jgi:hypothetical protein
MASSLACRDNPEGDVVVGKREEVWAVLGPVFRPSYSGVEDGWTRLAPPQIRGWPL